jgi:hypothetical protein
MKCQVPRGAAFTCPFCASELWAASEQKAPPASAIAAERRWVARRCAEIADEMAAESAGAGKFSATIERRWMGRRIASAIRDEFGLEEK